MINHNGKLELFLRQIYKSFLFKFFIFRKLKTFLLPYYLKHLQSVQPPSIDKKFDVVMTLSLMHLRESEYVSNDMDYICKSDVYVCGKSRLIYDFERKAALSEFPSIEYFYQSMANYMFHDELLKLFVYDPKYKKLLFNFHITSEIYLMGSWISLLHHGSENWMHWLSEILPRTFAGKSTLPDTVGLIVDDSLPNQMYETIKILYPKHRVVTVKKGAFVRVEKLFVPMSPSFTLMWERDRLSLPGLWSFDSKALLKLRRALLYKSPKRSDSAKKTYISRDSNFRRLVNETQLIRILKKNNFSIKKTGDMTVLDQCSLMRTLSVLLAQAGAALANIMFMNRGSKVKVLALNSKYVHYDYFQDYARIFGVELCYIKCKSSTKMETDAQLFKYTLKHPTSQDIVCNLKEIEKILNS